NTIDPLAGSYYVEWLTDEVERRAVELMGQIDELGGALRAIEAGVPQRWIAAAAYATERATASGELVKVGVNRWRDDEEPQDLRLFEIDPSVADRQLARLGKTRATRDAVRVARALGAVHAAATDNTNLMPVLIEAARARVTIGEIANVLRSCFGEYKEPGAW
ncbi:MAG: methylmalonyl-CoA mutase, N-terminal domain, partial [Actinomycetota bacterium]|nr:methylmalonyl-CoA mutase, N-terminal domain [Actinomycetota bacterium]